MTDDQLSEAYLWWRQRYKFKDFDSDVEPFLNLQVRSDWIVNTRTALMVSTSYVAEKMGVSRSSYSHMEKGEADGRLSLRNLRRIAEALDCELVYAIRPKAKTRFSKVVWEQIARKFSKQMHALPGIHVKQWPRAWGSRFGERMQRASFRREMGWTKRI
jgi:transcriptional regulator with XRE-family HTH domain